jgi:hypothetical protein
LVDQLEALREEYKDLSEQSLDSLVPKRGGPILDALYTRLRKQEFYGQLKAQGTAPGMIAGLSQVKQTAVKALYGERTKCKAIQEKVKKIQELKEAREKELERQRVEAEAAAATKAEADIMRKQQKKVGVCYWFCVFFSFFYPGFFLKKIQICRMLWLPRFRKR